jgi:hypothetical protein
MARATLNEDDRADLSRLGKDMTAPTARLKAPVEFW